jgi:hypothetical protein
MIDNYHSDKCASLETRVTNEKRGDEHPFLPNANGLVAVVVANVSKYFV